MNALKQIGILQLPDAAQKIANTTKHIAINGKAIQKFASHIDQQGFGNWLSEAPCNLKAFSPVDNLAFIFILNTVSFCYWGVPKWTIATPDGPLDGAWAMIYCLYHALIDTDHQLGNPHYLADLTTKTWQEIIKYDGKLQFAAERLTFLNALGRWIVSNYDGQFINVIEAANFDAVALADQVANDLPAFDDMAIHGNTVLPFRKRAQLLAADVAHAALFNKNNLNKPIVHQDKLTACADYKLPQLLRRVGIFEYNDALAQIIDNQVIIPKNSLEEIEIRACTIVAVKKICAALQQRGIQASQNQVNDYLWLLSQVKQPHAQPYHLTPTTAY